RGRHPRRAPGADRETREGSPGDAGGPPSTGPPEAEDRMMRPAHRTTGSAANGHGPRRRVMNRYVSWVAAGAVFVALAQPRPSWAGNEQPPEKATERPPEKPA